MSRDAGGPPIADLLAACGLASLGEDASPDAVEAALRGLAAGGTGYDAPQGS